MPHIPLCKQRGVRLFYFVGRQDIALLFCLLVLVKASFPGALLNGRISAMYRLLRSLTKKCKHFFASFAPPNLFCRSKRTVRSLRNLAKNKSSHKVSFYSWLGRQDSNLRMPGPKPGALPLGDDPIRCGNEDDMWVVLLALAQDACLICSRCSAQTAWCLTLATTQ